MERHAAPLDTRRGLQAVSPSRGRFRDLKVRVVQRNLGRASRLILIILQATSESRLSCALRVGVLPEPEGSTDWVAR